jgi:hypothetical protein
MEQKFNFKCSQTIADHTKNWYMALNFDLVNICNLYLESLSLSLFFFLWYVEYVMKCKERSFLPLSNVISSATID